MTAHATIDVSIGRIRRSNERPIITCGACGQTRRLGGAAQINTAGPASSARAATAGVASKTQVSKAAPSDQARTPPHGVLCDQPEGGLC